MHFDEFEKRFESLSIGIIYLLIGDEEFLKNEAVSFIKQRIFEDKDPGLNLTVFKGGKTKPDEILDELRSYPVLSKKRLVVIEEADTLLRKDHSVLLSYLKNPVDFSVLILNATSFDKRTQIAKLLTKKSFIVECPSIYEDKVPYWITQRVRKYGKSIRHDTATYLVEILGANLSQIDSELQKLAIFIGERSTIEPDDIEEIITKTRSYVIFKLLDALGERDTKSTLEILNSIFLSGIEGEKIRKQKLATFMIDRIARFIKKLWQARKILDNGGAAIEVEKRLNIHPYFLKKFLRGVQNFQGKELKAKYQRILDADVGIKTSSLPSKLILEELLMRLCK